MPELNAKLKRDKQLDEMKAEHAAIRHSLRARGKMEAGTVPDRY